MRLGSPMLLLAVAMVTVTQLFTPSSSLATVPRITSPVISCNVADILFVVNLQQSDASNAEEFAASIGAFQLRAESLINSSIGVGLLTFSSRVEFELKVTRNLTTLRAGMQQLLQQPPQFNGTATGDAISRARKLLLKYKLQLKELGLKRRLLAAVAVQANNTVGQPTAGTAIELRKFASNVFAVNLGEATRSELYSIASNGMRGIFNATNIAEVAGLFRAFTEVYCPCPFAWEVRQNCTELGRQPVTQFSYSRSQVAPFNCERQSNEVNETCDCPPNRIERSPCVNNTITVTTITYSRESNTSDCQPQSASTVEPCGRSSGCERFECPPGSVCSEEGGRLVCNCNSTSDVFSNAGCQQCDNQPAQVSRGPCLNGKREVREVTFQKLSDTQCQANVNTTQEDCEICRSNTQPIAGPCVRGYRQITQVIYRFRGSDGHCVKVLRHRRRRCRIQQGFQCVGSVSRGGQFVTFDSQLIDYPGPCLYTLTERAGSFRVSVQHGIKFPTLPFLTSVDAVNVEIGAVRFQLADKFRLSTNDGVQNLPFRDAATGVTAFIVDDALVLTNADLYVQFRAGDAVTVSVRSSANLTGLLGNCNGNATDDFTDAAGRDVSQQQSNRDELVGNSFLLTRCVTAPCCPLPQPLPTCSFNASVQATSLANCGLLAGSEVSAFAHCGPANLSPLLAACRNLYCRAEANPEWQRKLVCSVMDTAAYRCYLRVPTGRRNSFPIYRTQSFCPKSCGENAAFVNNANLCPRTCARHFFNSDVGCITPFGFNSVNIRNNTPIPGCQCRDGFVLDGNRCVRPNECECLSDLCINRETRSLCERWKREGRCRRNPLVMRKYCRLTCGLCDPVCHDQISAETCAAVRSSGRCNDTFYSQMCQLTCNPQGCECPPCKVVRSPCDAVNLNRRVSRYCYNVDAAGVCQRNLTSEVFEECGICQTDRALVQDRRCDYCNQTQIITTAIRTREPAGERRCIRSEVTRTNRSPGCSCNGTTERTVCYRGCDIFRIVTTSRASADCNNCLTSTQQIKVRTVQCPTTVVRGDCDRAVTKRRPVTVTRGLVRNCTCENITFNFEEMCECPPPRWTPPICFLNKKWIRWHISYHLHNGTCLVKSRRHVNPVPCPRRERKKIVCEGSRKYKIVDWFARRNCTCTHLTTKRLIGDCSCPAPEKITGDCVNNVKQITLIKYILEKSHCTKIEHSYSVPCSCPPAQRINRCNGETGVRTIGQRVFKLVRDTCQEEYRVTDRATVCRPTRVVNRGPCVLLSPDDKAKYQNVTFATETRVEGECRCEEQRVVKLEPCGCRAKLIEETQCPSNCPKVSAHCPSRCHRQRIHYRLRFYEGQCKREQASHEVFPCCCRRPKPVAPRCLNGHLLVKHLRTVQLKNGRCDYRVFRQVIDLASTCDLTKVLHYRRGDLLVMKRRKLRNCRCIWHEVTKHCPATCGLERQFTRCDPACNQRLRITVWSLRVGCHCVSKRRVSRRPTVCPDATSRIYDHCSTKGYKLLKVERYTAENCQCVRSCTVKRLPCSDYSCDSSPRETQQCDPTGHQMFKLIEFRLPVSGRCVQRVKRSRLPMPSCSVGSRRYVRCIGGDMVLCVRKSTLRHCRCRTKLYKRVLGTCDNYCAQRNQEYGSDARTKHKCNPITNTITTYQLRWQPKRHGGCVRRWQPVGSRAEPDCPAPAQKVYSCDPVSGKQRIVTTTYTMHRCKCVGPTLSVSYRSCRCHGRRVLKNYCDRRHGCRIHVYMLQSWNDELQACHARRLYHRLPIRCHHRTTEKRGRCIKGKIRYVRDIYWRDFNSCSCRHKRKVLYIDCRCRIQYRRQICKPNRVLARTEIVYSRYDNNLQKCVPHHTKRHYRRCRCPKATESRRCLRGRWELTKISYRLEGKTCVRFKSVETYAVPCSNKPVTQVKACNANCLKEQLTFRYRVNPGTCKCEQQRTAIRRCKCCNCPENKSQTVCVQDRFLRTTITYHSIRTKVCADTCKRRTRVSTKKIRCSKRREFGWGPCENCRNRKFKKFLTSVNCNCEQKQEWLDEYRSCCCEPRTHIRRKCQVSSGRWQTITSRTVLRQHKCRRVTSIDHDPLPNCTMPENPISYGECNNRTCKQSVIRTYNRLNKNSCACQLKQKRVGERDCCCLDTTPTRVTNCLNNDQQEIIVTTPVFNQATFTCESRVTRTVQQVQCNSTGVRTDTPPCTGQTRTIVSRQLVVQNCLCVQQEVERRTEACVCPNATAFVRFACDSSNGNNVFRRTKYTLTNGECVSSIEELRRPVICASVPTVDTQCDSATCAETVTSTRFELDREACSCKRVVSVTTGTCCCPTTVTTRRECIDNAFVTISSRQVLDRAARSCRTSEARSGITEPVACEPLTVRDFGCNPQTRQRVTRVVRQAISNCQCQVTQRSSTSQLCACPPTQVTRGNCSRDSCQRAITTVQYTAVNSTNGTLTCVPATSVQYQTCCCTKTGEQRVIKTQECDPQTGDILFRKSWKVFLAKNFKCRTVYKTRVKPLRCGPDYDSADRDIRLGRCDKRTGQQSVRIVWYEAERAQCRCRRREQRKTRTCSCKHLGRKEREFCDKERNVIVKECKYYVLNNGECSLRVRRTKKQVPCPLKRQVRNSCGSDCQQRTVTSFNKLSDCQCKRQQVVRTRLCCCPETQFRKVCNGDRWKMVTIRFKLSNDKRACNKDENIRYVKIKCKRRYKIVKGQCNTKTCLRKYTKLQYRPSKCSCSPEPVASKTVRCCCPRKQVRRLCGEHGHAEVIKTTVYKLRYGKCIAKVTKRIRKIRCQHPKLIRKLSCDPDTNTRKYIFRYYKLRNCKCKPKMVQHVQLCHCPAPRIVRTSCSAHRRYRAVYRISYHSPPGYKYKIASYDDYEDDDYSDSYRPPRPAKCKVTKKLLFKEPCHCPAPKRRRRCNPQGGDQWQYLSLMYKLKAVHGRQTCMRSHQIQMKPINCREAVVKRGPCIDGVRKLIRIKWYVRNCRCVKRIKVQRSPCYRPPKPQPPRRCLWREGAVATYSRVVDEVTGELRIQRKLRYIRCSDEPRIVPLLGGCQIHRYGGMYRKVAIISEHRVGCGCKRRRKLKLRLCGCDKPRVSSKCFADSVEKSYSISFHREHGRCVPQRRSYSRVKSCGGRSVEVRKGYCDKHTCLRSVHLISRSFHDCRCRRRRKVGTERCCTPEPVTKIKCRGNYKYTVTTLFELVRESVLARDSESGVCWRRVRLQHRRRTSRKRIRCPAAQVQQHCDRETGVLTKRVTIYRPVGCHCQPRMKTFRSRCRCPTPRKVHGSCVGGWRRCKKIYYVLDEEGHCTKRFASYKKRCACRPTRRFVRCRYGKKLFCSITYSLANECRPRKRCRSRQIRCAGPRVRKQKCDRKTGKRLVLTIRYKISRSQCSCVKEVVRRYKACACSRLDKTQRKCLGNVRTTVQTKYHIQDGACVPAVSVTHKKIQCRKQRVEVVENTCVTVAGVPRSGTQEARVFSYKPVNCRCKEFVRRIRVPCRCELIQRFRTRSKTVCKSDDTLRITTIRYVLEGLRCKRRVERTSRNVECEPRETRRDGGCVQDPIGDKFRTISVFREMPRSCKCRPVKVSSTRENCGCRPPKTWRRCVNNNLIESVITRYNPPEDETSSCVPSTSVTPRLIQCNETITKITPCNNVTQFQKVITISFEAKNCRCQRKVDVRKQRCLCPETRIGQEVCNPDTNQYEQRTLRFVLRNGECVRTLSVATRVVNCDTRSSGFNVTGPCQNSRRTVTTRTFQRSNCECVGSSRSANEVCDCTGVRRELGVCNGTQRVTYDRYYNEVLNATSGQCLEQLERQVVRYCQCDPPKVLSRVCVNNNIVRRITAIPTLVNNTCVESVRTDEQVITCPGTFPFASRTTRNPCDPTTFSRSVTTRVPVVQNCQCVNQERRNTEVCNCFQRNGGRQIRTECVNDTRSVTTVSYFYDSSPGICTERRFTQENRITCSGRKEERDECSKDSGKIEIRIFELRARSCGCVWQQQPSRFEACRCRSPKTTRRCLATKGKWLLLTKYWVVQQGRCVQKKQKLFRQVTCSPRVQVKHGECSRFSNTRKEVKILNERVGCECRERKVKRRCPCRCPGSRRWSVCRKNKIVTFSHAYRLRGCHCVKQSLCSQRRPLCKRRTVTKSTCLPGPNGDSFLTRICTKKVPIGCECQTVSRETRLACACAPRQRLQTRCSGHFLETSITRRLLIGSACRRVHVRTTRRSVTCPLSTLTTISNCGKLRYRRMKKVVWRRLKCKCVPVVTYRRQSCSRHCDLPLKLKRVGNCRKSSCTRRRYYIYKDGHCKPRYIVRTEKCCCKRPPQLKRRCLGNAFEVTRKFATLRNGVCVWSTVRFRQEIRCDRRLKYSRVTASNGRKIAVKTWYALKDCECKRLSQRLATKEKQCRAPRVTNRCINAPEQRRVKTVTRYVKVKGRCVRQDSVTETPIECSPAVVSRSACTRSNQRNAWIREIQRVTFRKVNCRCVRNEAKEVEVCRCRQPTVRTRCLRQQGLIEVIRTGYQAVTDGSRCEPVVSTKLLRVNCDSTWRPAPKLKRISAYSFNEYHDYTIMQREVRDGCRCKLQKMKRSCYSRCPKRSVRQICVNGNQLFKVISKYYKAGTCTCCAKIKHRQLQVELPPAKTIVGRCNRRTCNQQVTSISYVIDNCKPKEVRSNRMQKCCCKPPQTTRVCRVNSLRVTITTTELLTKSGTCDRNVRSDTQVVTCRRLVRERAVGGCVNGRQTYRREYEEAVNCECKLRVKRIQRPCAFRACRSAEREIRKCVNCKQLVKERLFTYDNDKRKCVSHKRQSWRKCCCPARRLTRRCVQNKLKLITQNYLFHSQSNRCVPTRSEADITGKIWRKCKLKQKTAIGGCMANGLRIISTVRVTLVNCRCIATRSFRFERCRCDPPVRTIDCVRNGSTVYSRNVTQTLDGNACRRRVDESFTPVECPVDFQTVGVCDETSCLRQVLTVNYTVSDCACQRSVVQRMETCCCPPAVNETRTCRRSDNTEVRTTTSQDFDLTTRACVTRSATATQAVVCEPNRRRILSACDIQRNNSLFQFVTDSETVASGCECVRQQQQTQVLCGCVQTEPQTICTADNRQQTFQIVYRPNANFTECLPTRVVLSERDVVCDSAVRSTVPQCTTGTRSGSGVTRVNVVRSWLERGPSCTCTRRVRVEPRICRCPDSPAPRVVCRRRNNERVEVSVRYTLVNSTDEPECIKTKVERSLGVVRCPDPVVNLTSCQFGLLQARTTVYHLDKCRCTTKKYKTFQRCSRNRPLCINKLPDSLCVYLDNAYGLCRKDFANSTSDVRHAERLCDKQCRRCDSCAAIGGKWRFQFSGRNCLVTDIRHQIFHITWAKEFKMCRKICKSNPLCASFDFYLPTQACSLARVDRQRLTELLHPKRHAFGTGPADLRLRDAESCGLYERFCSRRVQTHLEQVQLGCPRSHISNETSPCTCEQVSLAQGQYSLCYKTVTIEYYTRAADGKCQKRSSFIRTVCKEQAKCRDDLQDNKCSEVERNGGCAVTETARQCQRTCGLCQCSGREFVRHSPCDASSSTQRSTVYATEWIPAFGLCKLRISSVNEPCTNCEVGQRTIVSACINNTRTITKVHRKLVDGQCKEKVHTREVDCKGCYIGVHNALGACANGWRSVKTFFTQRVRGVCRELQVADRVACSGCPTPKFSSSACVRGRRQQRVTYFVKWPAANKCYAAHYVNELRCRPLCYNLLSEKECKYQVWTGQCKWNKFSQHACRRSCNMC